MKQNAMNALFHIHTHMTGLQLPAGGKTACCAKNVVKAQRSFDISVNLLNNNVLSDKLLWRNGQCTDAEKPADRILDHKTETPITVAEGPSCRPQDIPLEISLLTLPFCWLFAVFVLFRDSIQKPLVSTIVGCALVLATPALLIVGNHLGVLKKHMYAHILVIHGASLLVILNKRFVTLQCFMFVLVFTHLSMQHAARRRICFFVAIANAGTILIFENAIPHAENMALSIDLWCGAIVLMSAAVYATYVINTSTSCICI